MASFITQLNMLDGEEERGGETALGKTCGAHEGASSVERGRRAVSFEYCLVAPNRDRQAPTAIHIS